MYNDKPFNSNHITNDFFESTVGQYDNINQISVDSLIKLHK